MIAIVDYGLGNLFSLSRSLDFLGIAHAITREPDALRAASHIILPGVGAFGDAISLLDGANLSPLLRERAAAGVPFMGICLGMQLLFDVSYEYGEHRGLGLIPGRVCPLAEELPANLKVPHIGWNALELRCEHPLLRDVREGDCVYYVHSFYARDCEESIVATSEYGVTVPGLVARGNVMGAQFHPEKSGAVGLSMLRAFAQLPPAGAL